ncbi:hypothetical protein [Pseudofrankia sp. BMG5.36]|uniref:hypothetical protein n=1 Tax=Pseudofrankia sp. BMG5.36 TaxID=1834512 RepID=UPI0008DA4A2F|nr:hypothetical protein [Pseudofrankia sp. BMG5.36]OHV58686.1 hypothetical protein BCD48_42290 [Pseudofrankia sp. BMG5.36]
MSAHGSVATVTVAPGSTAAELAAQVAAVPNGAMLVGVFGDTTIILAYGPADDVASDRDVLAAVVAALAPETWNGWSRATTPTAADTVPASTPESTPAKS